VLDIDPNNFEAYNILGYYYFYTNDKGKAKLAWAKLQDLFGDSTLAAIFRKSDFESALKSWIERSFTPDSPFSSDHITRASVYAMLGDRENTLKYLQLAIRNHSYNVASIKVCQEYDFVRDDPRFIEIYEKAGLKAYDESRKYQNSGN
jgi:tetratricopeptide (TPR) repeat protein